MSLEDLDPLIHAPKRLGAMAMLSAAQWVEASFLREHLDMSYSDLSKQMSTLCDAGYAEVRKQGHGRSGNTWYSATRKGRAALDVHMAALRELVDNAPIAGSR
jgi:DNA-binding transcriptional ArsR family regulator